jgi:hypothetical protein
MTIPKTLLVALGVAAFAVPALADTTTTTPTAQQQCRTERAQMGTTTFASTYGTNKNKSNAYGKCVSQRAQATTTAQDQAQTNAAKSCKAERAADPAAFQTKYGSGKNGKNAYGKCVSQTAKAAAAAKVADETKTDVSAAKSCKAERAQDAAAFKAKYGTNKNKSNAFGKCVSKTAKAQSTDNTSTDGQTQS